jgi:4'-phosphopantetheinyl transferase
MMPNHSPLFWPPFEGVELQADRIAVWGARLDQSPLVREELFGLLSSDERTRAGRFHFEKDRDRFIASRGILRTVLGSYLGIEPGRLAFRCPGNKPALMDWCGGKDLHFNLSHSSGLGLFAFARRCEVGIDVEYIREIPEMEDIVGSFFSEREKAAFDSLPRALRREAFFKCWTRKEAVVKAMGSGLSSPLQDFDVSLIPGEPARILEIRREQEMASAWSLLELKPAPGYAAALAALDRNRQIECRQWAVEGDARLWTDGCPCAPTPLSRAPLRSVFRE